MAVANLDKPGVAFIVSNDYNCYHPVQNLDKLTGTHKDAERMSTAFKNLGYEVVPRKNLTRPALNTFLGEAAALPYTPSYKRLVLIFSGHGVNGDPLYDKSGKYRGNASGKLYSQEGHVIDIENIIDEFMPDKHPALGRMARLFFIDACRGNEQDFGMELRGRGMSEKGGQFLMPERVSKHGNILIAYSTLPNHRAYERSTGSLWMTYLANALQSQDNDIASILTDVSSKLDRDHKSLPMFQTPQYINQLTEQVNFFAESRSAIGVAPSGQPGNVGIMQTTKSVDISPKHKQSQPSVTKTPITILKEYSEQNKLGNPVYQELPAAGHERFRYKVTIRGNSYTGEIKGKKKEAQESAANIAVKRLVNSNPSLVDRGSRSVSAVKDLKEKYFDKKDIVFKKESHFVTREINGGYQCTLTINRTVFKSGKCVGKSDAENDAAKQALNFFKL